MNKLSIARWQAIFLLACVPLGFLMSPTIEIHTLESSSHFVETYLLPLFFLVVGIELRHEFTSGYFTVRKLIVAPAMAAVLGVAVPGIIFVLIAGPLGGAWSIPTATDITIGLAVLGLSGVGLATRLRARFLALATIDDLIGLLILLLVFSGKLNPLALGVSLSSIAIYYLMGRSKIRLQFPALACVAIGLGFGADSGLQNSIIAVTFGLLTAKPQLWNFLNPLNGWFILPLFAFIASANAGVAIQGALSATVLLAVCMRPLAKLAGITLGGSLGGFLVSKRTDFASWFGLGLLGGIGFTVSFLLANVSLGQSMPEYSAAIIGTLVATAISAVAFVSFASFRGRLARRDEKSL